MENVLDGFAFGEGDFERVRARIRDLAGIALTDVKREMVYNRLSRRLRACNLRTFAEYLRLIDADEAERTAFVNALTTNLTAFFREPGHFETLANFFRTNSRPFRIWSAAASTGEEAYSIAITACEVFQTLAPPCAVLATDVNTSVLEQARAGVYELERCKDVSPARLSAFFLRGCGARDGYARVSAQVQDIVTFRHLNLREPEWRINGALDAIFCRNVLIYFDKAMQRAIVERIVRLLRPGGLLFTGHSELLSAFGGDLRIVGRTTYERVAPL